MNFFNICNSPPEVQGTDWFGYVNNKHSIKAVEVSCFRWPISSMERRNVVSVLHLFFFFLSLLRDL